MKTFLLAQSIIDLTETCDELMYLTHEAQRRLSSSELPFTHILLDSYQTISETLESIARRLQHDSCSEADIVEIYELLTTIELELRNLQGIQGAVICAADWQSPSFAASRQQQAGQQTGTITMGINDYKRDQHAAGIAYEQAFRRAYISLSPFNGIQIYATNSGMAALTTILGFLQGEHKLNGPILVGKSCYFEEKNMLHALFPTQIIEVDEHDLGSIRNAIETQKPSAVFLDSVCNSPDMALPNIPAIVDIVRKQKRKNLILVVDNTGLSASYQPLREKRLLDPYVQIIAWESLLKHHQFGMDRGNGGMIYTNASDAIKLYDYRDHLGTNIAESTVLSFPTPNKTLLIKRLLRHERNTRSLSQSIQGRVIFPGLPSHPSGIWSQRLTFHGSLLTVSFDRKHRNMRTYKRFLHSVLSRAKKKDINIVAGSSFGFSTTRIYIPASYGHQAEPFVRIAIGTEPAVINDTIVEIITQTIKEIS